MSVCILSVMNIKHMSLISLYTDLLDRVGIPYDIIYIDRYGEEERTNARSLYRYSIRVNREWSKARKVLAYWGFKSYAQRIMDSNKYDYAVVWRTETAIMFVDYLSRKMNGRYCVNVRDYCMERNPLVHLAVSKAIKNAGFTTISSDGFRAFLPDHEYITVHSLNEGLLERCVPRHRLREPDEPLRICFVGYVRFLDIDRRLLSTLGNDPRYVLQYFGEGSQHLEKFAEDRGIHNVEFAGRFPTEETLRFLASADVINNLYGHGRVALDTAISIKYYYALHMNIPILVFKDTYMEQVSHESGIGFAVGDSFDGLGDDLYSWYHSIHFEDLRDSCRREIISAKKANDAFRQILVNSLARIGSII